MSADPNSSGPPTWSLTGIAIATALGLFVVVCALILVVAGLRLGADRAEQAGEEPAAAATSVRPPSPTGTATDEVVVTPPEPSPTPEEEVIAISYPPLAPLPPAPFPLDNPFTEEKAELGRMLYFDPRMSGDGSLSCASCHPTGDGSWGVSSAISFGYPGSSHWRNAQTIINTAYYSKLNWDGSATSIEKQNNGAWTGAVGANVDSGMAEERLAQVPEYVELFAALFGDSYPSYDHALLAVATFQRTIVSRNVPFDAFLGGDETAISEEARRGYELFIGEANCLACHNGALISDDSYHNTGVPTYPGFETNALNQITFRFEQWAKGVTEAIYDSAREDLGLYYVTKLASDIGKFRTPGLRDVCYTAPYMHNGSFATLAEVVSFYNAGGGDHPNRDPLLQPLGLSSSDQSDLVTFLESLCGERIIIEAPELPDYQPWPRPEGN